MRILPWLALALLPVTSIPAADNTLTPEEQQSGWTLLFDGVTPAGWHGAGREAFPASGWEVRDGELRVTASEGTTNARAGDIASRRDYANFEFSFDFKVAPGGNSGVKYLAVEVKGAGLGPEYQILDDERHPDAKKGRDGTRTLASLYDVIPATNRVANPPGQWNTGRIVVNGRQVEHWLNGRKVVEFERGSPAFRAAVAASKFKDKPGFGEAASGRIILQDHGNAVAFKNLKIRER